MNRYPYRIVINFLNQNSQTLRNVKLIIISILWEISKRCDKKREIFQKNLWNLIRINKTLDKLHERASRIRATSICWPLSVQIKYTLYPVHMSVLNDGHFVDRVSKQNFFRVYPIRLHITAVLSGILFEMKGLKYQEWQSIIGRDNKEMRLNSSFSKKISISSKIDWFTGLVFAPDINKKVECRNGIRL